MQSDFGLIRSDFEGIFLCVRFNLKHDFLMKLLYIFVWNYLRIYIYDEIIIRSFRLGRWWIYKFKTNALMGFMPKDLKFEPVTARRGKCRAPAGILSRIACYPCRSTCKGANWSLGALWSLERIFLSYWFIFIPSVI